ncbi:MAG: hypothetical protein CVU97_05230 [Firmicutes bacterium HGW-Firmicutes-21]|nr:MAG: hypothetical protein CVU97_05230 [Firmicutes bacterium HGW-Firmicutes-21]
MSTACKYNNGRSMPVDFSNGFSFVTGCFNLILLKQGYLSLLCGQSRIIANGPSLICLSGKEEVALGAAKGSVSSLAFAPSFMNVHLNYELIYSKDYPSISEQHLFPTFDIFLHRSDAYGGVLPLGDISLTRFGQLFDRIALQLFKQPTMKWSCKVRSELFILFDMAEFNLNLLENGSNEISDMLESIHSVIDTNLSLLGLFKQYNTTATTMSRKFKKYFGVTAINYVLDLRLTLCSYVLAFTDITATDIAESYEFFDSTYFARMFKRKFSCSPYDFRVQKRTERDALLR